MFSGGIDMSNLLEALQSATQDDLDAIEARLTELEQERAGLLSAKKVLTMRLSPIGKRASPGTGKKGREQMTEKAAKIHDLLTAEGSLPQDVIARRLGVSSKSVERTAQLSDWLTRTPDGDIAIAMS